MYEIAFDLSQEPQMGNKQSDQTLVVKADDG
jgi:hypothetical protein